MSRKALALASLLIVGLCAVAIVRAQDSSRLLASPAKDSPVARPSYGSDASPRQAATPLGSLKAVSQSVTAEYASPAPTPANRSTSLAPATAPTPAYAPYVPAAAAPRFVDEADTAQAGPLSLSDGELIEVEPSAGRADAFRLSGDQGATVPAATVYGDNTASPAAGQSVLKRRDAEAESFTPDRVAARNTPAPLRDPEDTPVGPRPTPPALKTAVPLSAPPPLSYSDTSDESEDPAERTSSRRPQRFQTAPMVGGSPSMQPTPPIAGILTAGQGALIRLETVGPRAISLGKRAAFTVLALNQSDFDGREIVVRIALPIGVQLDEATPTAGDTRKQADADGVEHLVWTIHHLEKRGRQQLNLQLIPTENRPFELLVDWTTLPVSSVAQIEVQKPELEVTLSGAKELLFGQSERYTIIVSNPGTGDAENVAVQLASGQSVGKSHRVGTVPAGQQRQIEVELAAQQAGVLELTAIAAGDGGLRSEVVRSVHVRQAQLEIEIAGPPLKYAGTVATYQIRVANVGDAPAERVEASVVLPQGAKYLPTREGLQPSGTTPNWLLGNMRPGGEAIFAVSCQLMTAGENRVEVRVRGGSNLAADRIVATRVESIADLKLVVHDPKGPKPCGEEVVYEVEVTNRGTKAAEQVNVVAQFSDGIEPIRAEGGHAELVTGQVIFHPLARIEPGQKVTLRVTARATVEGDLRFRAEVTSGEAGTRVAAEESTRYYKLVTPQLGSRPKTAPR